MPPAKRVKDEIQQSELRVTKSSGWFKQMPDARERMVPTGNMARVKEPF